MPGNIVYGKYHTFLEGEGGYHTFEISFGMPQWLEWVLLFSVESEYVHRRNNVTGYFVFPNTIEKTIINHTSNGLKMQKLQL